MKANPFPSRRGYRSLAVALFMGLALPLTGSASPSLQDIEASFNQKESLLKEYEKCQELLNRWEIENDLGPECLRVLQEYRQRPASQKSSRELLEAQNILYEQMGDLYIQKKKLETEYVEVSDAAGEAWALMDKEWDACNQGDAEACKRAENLRDNVYGPRREREVEHNKVYTQAATKLAELTSRAEKKQKLIDAAREAEEKVQWARECVAGLLAKGYHVNQGDAIGRASFDVIQAQCDNLRDRYFTALQSYLDLVNEHNSRVQNAAAQQEAITPQAVHVVPNRTPNPFATLPQQTWGPSRPMTSDRTHFDPNRIRKAPPKPADSPPAETVPSKPQYGGGGQAFGY